jgi:hypothetical protein
MSTTTDARAFATNPAEYFGDSWHAMQHVPPDELAELQLGGLQLRFEQLRDQIPTLQAMAAEQGIDRIERHEDVVPLLFQHSVYKSYPISLLENNRFDALTKWLDRLTTHDLSGIDASGCDSIDSWLELLDTETELRVAHSSGTAGTMTFLPRSATEWDRMFQGFHAGMFQFSDPNDEQDHEGEYFNLIWPLYRHGRSAITRLPDMAKKRLMGDSEERIHAMREGWISADAMFLAGRLRAAEARGEVDELQINPALAKRSEEFQREQLELQQGLPRFIEETIERLRGERIWLLGTWNILYGMAKAGLEAGMTDVFSSDSLITTGGGAKGQVVPDDWEDEVKRFTGVDRLQHGYGMTEFMGIQKMCEEERYHFEPHVVPFVLDPDDGSPLPREGEQTGRFAFFDLLAESYWGGFISGDEVSLSRDVCECGRTTPHIARKIERFSDKKGGDDKITCAASDEAHANALEFLNTRLA